MADRVVVLNAGQVEQIGSAADVYDHPATPFVYEFLGDVNLFHGRVHDGHANIGDAQVLLPEGAARQDAAIFYVRPHEIDILRENPNGGSIAAKVFDVRPLGATVWVELERRDGLGIVEVEMVRDRYTDMKLQPGEPVYLQPRRIRVFGESCRA